MIKKTKKDCRNWREIVTIMKVENKSKIIKVGKKDFKSKKKKKIKELSNEEKYITREYGRNRCRNMSEKGK